MKKFVIEREIPQVGALDQNGITEAASTSNKALRALAPKVQWQHSYVTGDRTFCIYLAQDEDVIRQHAEMSGFPASRIYEVVRVIDPTTASK